MKKVLLTLFTITSTSSLSAALLNENFDSAITFGGVNTIDPASFDESFHDMSVDAWYRGGGQSVATGGQFEVRSGGSGDSRADLYLQSGADLTSGNDYTFTFDFKSIDDGSLEIAFFNVNKGILGNGDDAEFDALGPVGGTIGTGVGVSATLGDASVTQLGTTQTYVFGDIADGISYTFTAGDNDLAIVFNQVATGAARATSTLDNLSLAPVPEPSAYGFIGGFAAFAFALIRRRR